MLLAVVGNYLREVAVALTALAVLAALHLVQTEVSVMNMSVAAITRVYNHAMGRLRSGSSV